MDQYRVIFEDDLLGRFWWAQWEAMRGLSRALEPGGGLLRRKSADHFVVVGMRAYPEPEVTAVHVNGEGSITQADPDGPVTADFLELQRWVARIALEHRVIYVS